jgi:two-component system, NarL family, sensor kinase
MQSGPEEIALFLIVVSAIIIGLIVFVISILYLYKKRQQFFEKSLGQLILDHENALLTSQLEMQEETFKHISREIHDNISLSLTLAKLNLHTVDVDANKTLNEKISNSIELISKSILELSDISKSLNADIIGQQGLLKAIEQEVLRIEQIGLFKVLFTVKGNPVFMDAKKELIIFRIIQEAFNNILKHALSTIAELNLEFSEANLLILIKDNGKGFDTRLNLHSGQAGLNNMRTRSKVLGGVFRIYSTPGVGTQLFLEIPVK